MTDLDHHGDAELAPGLVDLAGNVRDPATSVAFAADLAAILDPALPATPALRDLPRIPEEIR